MIIFKAWLKRNPGLQTVATPSMGSSEPYFLNGVPIQSVHMMGSPQTSQIGEIGF